ELYPNSWAPTIVALIVVIGSTLSIIALSLSLFIFFYFKRDTIYQEFHPQGQGRMEKKLADESCFDIKKGAHLL
ncbi:hypothetical protein CDAR_547641, partial [Caerostris darwini]